MCNCNKNTGCGYYQNNWNSCECQCNVQKTNVDAAVKVKRYVALDQSQNVAAIVLKKIKEVIIAKKRKARNSFSYIVKAQIFFVIEL